VAFSLFLFSDPAVATGIDSLFRSEEIIEIELRSDFSEIQKERTENPGYHEGKLIYLSQTGDPVELEVRVMARGNFRLKPENCNFPPLMVDFKKSDAKNTLFENQDKLKLVTPCQTDEDLIDEYTVYKMYNVVTDLSFKVRLARILYFDTGTNKAVFERYSFFLEDKDHVAERNNLVPVNNFITPFEVNRDNYIKLSFFQYLIGNKDWWVSSRKNTVIMQAKDSTGVFFAMPYDFDFSVFVNADYTKPGGDPNYSIADRRMYKGICFTDEEYQKVFEFYRELRPVLESIVNTQDLISRNARKEKLRFIKEFYTVIDNRYLRKQNILNLCETRQDYKLAENI
jgi:hypothetical protein